MFFFDGDAFGKFGLVLVVVDGFAVNLDGHLLDIGCFKDAGDVIGDAHQIDGGRSLVDQRHGGLNLLRSVRTQAAGGVRFIHLSFQHFELFLLKGHGAFCRLDSLWQHGVGQVVREVGF